MASASLHVPLGIVKRSIIDKARIIAQNDADPTGDFDINVIDQTGNVIARVHGTINIIRTALTPNVFGANVTVEGHYFDVPAGEGEVDYDLILQQIDDHAIIGPSSVRIRGFELIQGNDPDAFHDQVHGQILSQW